ncbi:cell division protein ZapE [Deinococcus maricopensis]|uniref:AFG1-family ATPase n=1 Tax=Deinococcus maricopensis (strain DSM 21211 / LMG 22137 / NRRL B-23946 / LB-34) TaxID=709986 RepID=E8U717_DEIML|nr:cell division protein ZapE [Deinococcus maricopensis]ADV66856.1 AFG1-family ATPase [Deinococcus maricopensis DSM 21211]
MIDLSTRTPSVTPEDLLTSFVPSRRFQDVRFSTYRPNPAFPSQAAARDHLTQFVDSLRAARAEPRGLLSFLRRPRPPEGRGVYLDGGFGVGKTHLLASTWYAFEGKKAFMSFQELLYALGLLGMERAQAAFGEFELLCIDEFELDDPGNTHMVNTFLGALMPNGLNVVTTSNTEPGALGQGRFNARDFARQIQEIASRFETLRVDGPDYRQRSSTPEGPLDPPTYAAWSGAQDPATFTESSASDLNRLMLTVHPARFGKWLEGVQALGVTDVQPMRDQNVALRFVHLVDKAYDLGLQVAFTGAPLGTLFAEEYRHGAFAKKYARCLSRMSELLVEARQALPTTTR